MQKHYNKKHRKKDRQDRRERRRGKGEAKRGGTRECRYGSDCRDMANCRFKHSRRREEPRRAPAREARVCKYGDKCYDLRRGICPFKHDREHLGLIEDQANFDAGELADGDGSFVPRRRNKDQASVLKGNLRRWAKTTDEETLKKAVRISQMVQILDDPRLEYSDYSSIFAILGNVLALTDRIFRRRFVIEAVQKGLLANDRVLQFRKMIFKSKLFERGKMGRLLGEFVVFWRFLEMALELVPAQIELIQTDYLAKISQYLIAKARPYTELVLDEEDEQLARDLETLGALKERVAVKRQAVHEHHLKRQGEQAATQKMFQLPRLDVPRDEAGWNPPNAYRTFQDYPQPEEIQAQREAYLSPVVVRGAYQSVEHYLDVHYRLIREDFLSSTKAGMRTYRMNRELDAKNQKKNFDLAAYSDVQVAKYVMTRRFYGLCLRIPFRVPKGPGQTRLLKKFMFGSMVLLSADGFETFMIGIIRHKDDQANEQSLKRYGHLQIVVEVVNSELSLIEQYQRLRGGRVEMLESRCYFEAYYYVLRTLKGLSHFPLARVIVHCDTRANTVPDYLRLHQAEIARLIGDMDTLDASQRAAVEATFRQRLSIVQGPPGTGKTFVGVKIMQVLLHLKNKLNAMAAPVVVVCYTNHALDQFLEHILDFTNSVCRLGGRTKNEHLKNFSLRSLLEKNTTRRSSSFYQTKTLQTYKLRSVNQLNDDYFEMDTLGVLKAKYFTLGSGSEAKEKLIEQYSQDYSDFVRDVPKKRRKGFKDYFQGATGELPSPWFWYWLGLIDFDVVFERYEHERKNPVKPEDGDESGYAQDEETELDRYQEFDRETQKINEETRRLQRILHAPPLSHLGGDSFHSVGDQIGHMHKTHALDSDPAELLQRVGETFVGSELSSYTTRKRWQINLSLLGQTQRNLSHSIRGLCQELKSISEDLKHIEAEQQMKVLEQLDVLAMTTTGASKYKEIMSRLQSKVIVVEEAAEVLEAQIVTSMSAHIEHAVLIGDHQQLRPSVNSYRLAKDYFLEVSLFERLVRNDFPNSLLTHQRRMRPEVSALVKLIYPRLQDHPSVRGRKAIRGVSHNVFFFTHGEREQSDAASKYNTFEAKMVVRFADYLVKQGYRPGRITILSLYLGQLMHLKQFLRKNKTLEGVLVKTVDNYQGEENDIVILSLVRSNKRNNIGFLKVSNRVCVALSRARRGLFIFGDARVLRAASEKTVSATIDELDFSKEAPAQDYQEEANEKKALWIKVLGQLRKQKAIMSQLSFKCTTHGEQSTIKTPKDFRKVPGGGCTRLCETRLNCGHSCKQMCHPVHFSDDASDGHDDYRCLEPCIRQKECGHACKYRCYQCKEEAKPCKHIVKVKYDCGHLNRLKCHFYQQNKGLCMEPCENTLECGHRCGKKCHEDCTSLSRDMITNGYQSACRVPVEKQLPCGHMKELGCGQSVELFLEYTEYKCDEQCAEPLPDCGHPCPRACHDCKDRPFHGECVKKCEALLTCNHTCIDVCTGKDEQCPPCQKDCEIACSHSKCPKQCGEICAPCVEPCDNKCRHSRCTKKCYEPCDREPCQEPCDKRLECGHECIGLCGDPCPAICRECDSDHETFSIFFGTENEPDARFVLLPDCGHVIESHALDRYFTLSKGKDRKIEFQKCPRCSTSIKNCSRYQHALKRVNQSVNIVKQRSIDNLRKIKRAYINPQSMRDIEAALQELCESKSTRVKDRPIRRLLRRVSGGIHANLETVQKSNRVGSIHISTIASVMNIWLGLLGTVRTYRGSLKKTHFDKLGVLTDHLTRLRLSKHKLQQLGKIAHCFELYFFIKKSLNEYKEVEHLEAKQGSGPIQAAKESLKKMRKRMIKKKFIIAEDLLETCKEHLKTMKVGEAMKAKFRRDIVQAIGLKKGHWYQCVNGHPYVIGECGGAMEESRCPECNSTIGGTEHRLASGNRHAGHWDQSSMPAWDERHGEQFARELQARLDRGE